MTELIYVGEHLGAGALGRALVVLAFVAALVATASGIVATQRQRRGQVAGGWGAITGWSFAVQGVGIAGVMTLLFTMMTQHWYEYQYVQAHVNDDLAFKYVFTAFWEGQEGSFLLWLVWHAVLGGVVWATNKSWRLPVVAIIASAQVVLLSMLLGLYLPFGEGFKLGSSPFLLLREVMDAPIFGQSDYVSLLEGKGLNPLLQNYWMLIHPPTLFLGFASTIVPFAFAMAALWTGRHKAWLTPALKWSLFSAGILGIGILMGGAWAYEALNFGGYWAWDPVENASLVPWLLLVAGIHTNLIARATGHSVRSTYIFYALTFVAIIYSSFLTRSGILGETSVHAFVEMGLEAQLTFLLLAFTALPLVLLALRWNAIPTKAQEEKTASREFWMFLGSLVLLFSAGMITVSTSLPVFNKLADAAGLDIGHLTINEPVAHYNRYQLWVGVFMGLFTGVAQYLRWRGLRGDEARRTLGRLAICFGVSLVLALLTARYLADTAYQFTALAFAAYFAILANVDYLLTSKTSLWQRAGSFASHVGFGLLLIGVLFSGLNKHHISKNTFAMEGLLSEEQIGKNVVLVKGLPMVINGYEVTYLGDSLSGNRRDFEIGYRELSREGEIGRAFTLAPYALYTNDFAKIASMNPDTRHYWDHDVFTHITALPPASQSAEQAAAFEDSLRYERYELPVGASAKTTKHEVTLLEVNEHPSHPDYAPEPGDIALGARVKVKQLNFDSAQYAEPVVVLRENLVYSFPAQINAFNSRVQLPEAAFEAHFGREEALDYREVKLKMGDATKIGDRIVQFRLYETEVTNPGYAAVEGDVAVEAQLTVTDANNQHLDLAPVFVVRDRAKVNVKDSRVDPATGERWHARFASLDPSSGTATLQIAVEPLATSTAYPIEIAENASRGDWIVLEATVFPGINVFWVGSILMLAGLLISMGFRMRERVQLRGREAKPRRVSPTRTVAPTPAPTLEPAE